MTFERDVGASIDRIARRDWTIAVVGLGYVGVPLVVTALKAGFPVLGFDIDPDRVAVVNSGESFIRHIATEPIASALADGRFCATGDFSRLGEADAILIAVPTPLSKQREPDLSFVEATADCIAKTLRPGQLVVLESTTWPGTTEEILKPRLEATGLRSGIDFFLAYSPEREDPGNQQFPTASIPKIIGGDGDDAKQLATALYDALVSRTVPVSSTATAEAVKLLENIFRGVNIALVNEMKTVFTPMGIDVWEVIEAAKTKPFGFMPFYPGPGLGGHCIPIDPFYLTWKAREFSVATRFIELAGEINTAMPHRVVEDLARALDNQGGRGLKGANLLVLGVAYKKNIEDTRESPALKLISLMKERKAKVVYHDPLVPEIPVTREHPELAGVRSVALCHAMLSRTDAVLIATDHDGVDYAQVVGHAPLVVDTRNVCARMGLKGGHIVKA